MSDVSAEATASQLLQIPVTKAGRTIAIDTMALPLAVYEAALAEGLKSMLNRGMSKITGISTMEGDKLVQAQDAAFAIAEKNAKAMLDGSIKIAGAKGKASGKTPKAVMDEARRMAKAIVKTMLRDAGYKITSIPAKEITAAANVYIANNPSLLDKAQEALTARDSVVTEDTTLSAVLAGISVQKAEPKPLSAKQAGKTKTRSKKASSASASV